MGTHGEALVHMEHPAQQVQSNGGVISDVDTAITRALEESHRVGTVLVQFLLKGGNKTTFLTEL